MPHRGIAEDVSYPSIVMPLTKKGKKIMGSMKKQYGSKKGKQVFYASQNKGTIKGTHKGRIKRKGKTIY